MVRDMISEYFIVKCLIVTIIYTAISYLIEDRVRMNEIKKDTCPICGCSEYKVYERSKGVIKYKVIVCTKCKTVVRRKIC